MKSRVPAPSAPIALPRKARSAVRVRIRGLIAARLGSLRPNWSSAARKRAKTTAQPWILLLRNAHRWPQPRIPPFKKIYDSLDTMAHTDLNAPQCHLFVYTQPFLRVVAGSWSCVICPGAGGRRGQPGLLPGQPVDALAGILPRKNAGQLTPVRTVVVDRGGPVPPEAPGRAGPRPKDSCGWKSPRSTRR